MSKNQDILPSLEAVVAEKLTASAFESVRIRERKMVVQMEELGIDILDVYYVLKHHEAINCLSQFDRRYKVAGKSIDNVQLVVMIIVTDEGELSKIVNVRAT